MGYPLSAVPASGTRLPNLGCCQSHSLLFQFLLDSLLTSHRRIQEQITTHKGLQLDELVSSPGEWLGRMGPLMKLQAYSGLYAQQQLAWQGAAARVARGAQRVLELALRCQSPSSMTRLTSTIHQLAQQLLTLVDRYRDDERVLLLMVRRRSCLEQLYGASFLSDFLSRTHGSLEQGLAHVQEKLQARGYEVTL
jgi:hypothetical protein